MALWPVSITLNGVSIPLADVLAAVTIHHGRTDVFDDPTATTAQITLRDRARSFVERFDVGQDLALLVQDPPAPATPRFTGRVTDASLDGDDLTVIAVGALSTLRGFEIGATADWPEEAWSDRVERVFSEAGLASLLELVPDPSFDPVLAARDHLTAGETTLGDYLAFLAGMVGAAVVDRLDGKILVQAIGARSVTTPTPLDPAIVAYSPRWVMGLPRANIVTVRYEADQGASVEASDPASIALYDKRPGTIDTAFKNSADATRRASTALGRGAYAHWNIYEAPILRGLDELAIGAPVELTELPAASPYDPWTPIVEGWTDEISGDSWTMTLALSDPLWSGAVLTWTGTPTDLAWDETDPATAWADALSLDDLVPD